MFFFKSAINNVRFGNLAGITNGGRPMKVPTTVKQRLTKDSNCLKNLRVVRLILTGSNFDDDCSRVWWKR